MHSDVPLPPPKLRPGEKSNQDDAHYVQRTDKDVARLVDIAALSSDSRLIDWGCGPGRLAVGVARRFGRIAHYHGVDVDQAAIEWAREHFDGDGYEWTLIDAANARYNPDGNAPASIPAASDSYDVLWAFSVLSHMDTADLRAYLPEVARVLAPSGVAVVSAFVETDVPDETENPEGYLDRQWSGPLHCVRYEQGFLSRLFEEAGLTVDQVQRRSEPAGQSLVIARPV